MLSKLAKANWYLKFFGITKIPLLWYCRPNIIELSSEKVEIKIPLKHRTKNHLGSMYFGALSVGADITGGFLAMPPIQKSKRKIILVFKDFNAKFLRRAESDVHFLCKDGQAVSNLVDKAIETGERQNYQLTITATTPKISDEIIAEFALTLSIKDYTNI